MAENIIELKTIRELLNKKFFIPSYQRGYRWTEQQVVDLLNDIEEFRTKQSNNNGNTPTDDFYCLQPLVVKETVNVDKFKEQLFSKVDDHELLDNTRKAISDNTKWEVIDGQQRLTTMYILLSFFKNIDNKGKEKEQGDGLYEISYQTKAGRDFTKFFESIIGNSTITQNPDEKFNDFVIRKFKGVINQHTEYDNIDFFHILQTWETIKKWFVGRKIEKDYKSTILDRVKFIWYESVDENPIRVFTRLNIGKIKLTNAELIKALFLNRSNFNAEGDKYLKLRQQEIASEWDNIEYTLQNDEFWLFLHAPDYDKPTRIDFIFDLICEQDSQKIFRKADGTDKIDKGAMDKSIGTDEYRTFRYFYEYFKRENTDKSTSKSKLDVWDEVKKYFHTFQEWFNDLELYHYVGTLRTNDFIKKENSISELVEKWNGDKKAFVVDLKNEIAKAIKLPHNKYFCNPEKIEESLHFDDNKTLIRKILLIHNVQTIVIQNKCIATNDKYKLPVFYKFPFHLFKKEKWDVEHIDSNTPNDLTEEKQQREWLLAAWIVVSKNLQEEIENFLIQNGNFDDFDEIRKKVVEQISSTENGLDESERMRIWNLALLDGTTNKGYHNDIFPLKRRCLIGKDQGKIIDSIIEKENDSLKIKMTSKKADISFIPICTKNAFLKYYTPITNNLMDWDKTDAEAYRQNILETLKDFGVTDSSNNQNKEKNEQQ